MRRARLHSILLLVFAVAACGGDDDGVSVGGTAPLVTIAASNSTPTPTPSPAPAPVTTAASSLLPFIDNAKIPAAEVGFSEVRIKPLPSYLPTPAGPDVGAFRIVCKFSHMNYDDPIVYPGKKGAAHLHTYFGNTAVDYASTQQSIEATGNSTCSGGTANRSGYWVPAVIDTKDGTPVKPDSISVYYKTSYAVVSNNVSPFPAGLRMIAGDMKSTGPQQYVGWTCYNATLNSASKTIPADCPVGATLEANIEFPICWDGVNLDSPDHKSHMSYGVQGACPASHPVLLPTITEKVQYTITEAGQTARWRLSSDNYGTEKAGGYSLHADWFNGWDPKVQDIWIKNCLRVKMDCHSFLLGDGTTLF